jgi:hypothetical protein
MVDGEDDMEIMNGQDPFLLVFEPLRFLKSPTLGAVSIFSGFVVKLKILAFETHLQDAAQSRRTTNENGAHGFGLLIRKWMRFFIFPNMFAENASHIIFRP